MNSLCKKTPNTALLEVFETVIYNCKLPGFKNFESLVFDAF